MDNSQEPCETCRTAAPRRLCYPEAAKELRITESWLRRHITRLPHTKLGRVVYFTDDDLRRIDALFHHEPSNAPISVVTPSVKTLVPLPSRRSTRSSVRP